MSRTTGPLCRRTNVGVTEPSTCQPSGGWTRTAPIVTGPVSDAVASATDRAPPATTTSSTVTITTGNQQRSTEGAPLDPSRAAAIAIAPTEASTGAGRCRG